MSAPERSEVVIVGGGIQGLLLAFNLADRGCRHVTVLDAGYWQGGASGRNGTLVRGGFSSPEWTAFFEHSVQQWLGLSRRLGENVMYTPRGYLIIAESERTEAVIETAAATHRTFGVRSRRVPAAELPALLPAADHARIRAVIDLADGGTAPHHAVMKAARAAAEAKGVTVRYQTPVTALERQGRRIVSAEAGGRRHDADLFVIASGAHSSDVARLAGVDLDAEPFRIEAMASEPVRPLITQAIALIDRLTYLHQTARGEIVGGAELPGETAKRNIVSTEYVMPRYARHLVEMFPQVASLRIRRQWSGMLHPAPDGGPLVGPHPDLDNLWVTAGWTYGIAGAPGAADLLSRAIVTGTIDPRMAAFAVDRFRRGRPVPEASAVIDNASAVTRPEKLG
ncbi:MAG: FAD-dependent oxidoreductase [Hyphomicrobiaceae bacterium]